MLSPVIRLHSVHLVASSFGLVGTASMVLLQQAVLSSAQSSLQQQSHLL
jgi:hypothetical protein